MGAGPGTAPGRAGGYDDIVAVVLAGTYAGPARSVESAGCVVAGVTPVLSEALVLMGDAVCRGMPAMMAL